MSKPVNRYYRGLELARGNLLLLAFGVMMGCGESGLEMAPVSGKVRWQGKPVTEGTITFYSSTGQMASGPIAADGLYILTTKEKGDGAVPGSHSVTISARKVTGGAPMPKTIEDEVRIDAGLKPVKVTWLVPEKYSQSRTSPLKREVQQGENVIDFDLQK